MIDRKNIPVVVECYADNGEHSHFKLIDVETGDCLWEESETAHNSDHAICYNCGQEFEIEKGLCKECSDFVEGCFA